MKKIYSFLAVLFCTTAFAQMMNLPKDTLIKYDKATAEKIIKESSYIFEGTLVKKENAFWVKNRGVYTPNIVQINKIFRGGDLKLGTIEVITLEGSAKEDDSEWIAMEAREMDGLPFMKFQSGQSVLLFCIPADSNIKPNPKLHSLTINTDNTIRLQPKDWHIIAVIYLPQTDGSISWMNLSFKNKKELYDFISKQGNIKIPKETIEKKSPKNAEGNKSTLEQIKNIPYEQKVKNYNEYMQNMQVKLQQRKTNQNNVSSASCNELFISEMLEGGPPSSKNKVLEIFNPTNAAISLAQFSIRIFQDGAPTPLIIPLSGSIAAKGTHVVAHPLASSAILAKTDQTDVKMIFDGNDAITLNKQTTQIDKIGEIGIDPGNSGWTVPPSGSTKSQNLRRKFPVNIGDTIWNIVQNQWDIFPPDSIQNIKQHQNVCSAANDISFSFANPMETGTSPKYFEFDIMAEANNSSTYFDNCLLRIDYNTTAFGSSVVANNKVTITKGANFNSVTYIDPDVNAIDQTSSVMGVPFGTDFNQSSWNRTLVTTTPQQMLHFKIEIQTCNEFSNINFTDITFTPIFSFYTVNANDNITASLSYDNTNYLNNLNQLLSPCFQISGFNSPLNAGVGDILTITGNNFGNIRGNGQVKFKNADDGGTTYIQKLNNIDYLSWTDTQIQIKVPSLVDSLGTSPFIPKAPGSGKIRIVTNANDSIDSSTDLKIYYGIINGIPLTPPYQKLRANLMSTDTAGGYTIHLNPNLSANAAAKGCIIKAMHDWTCYTTINWHLGTDTAIASSVADGVSVLYFGTPLNPNANATTSPDEVFCSSTNTEVLRSADIVFNQNTNWFFDTTGAAVPAGQFDFYAVALHELGHFHLLTHVNDVNELMYYESFVNPVNRLVLLPSTAATDGAFDVVSNSLTINIAPCSSSLMIPQNVTNCTNAVDEINGNSFNINVYPNPSNGAFTIQSSKKISAIEIVNILGEKIYSEKINSAQAELNLNIESKGIYLYRIFSGNKISSGKLIIQ